MANVAAKGCSSSKRAYHSGEKAPSASVMGAGGGGAGVSPAGAGGGGSVWGVVCAAVIKILPRLDSFISRLYHPIAYGFSFALLVILLLDVKNEMMKGKGEKKRTSV